MNFFWSLYLNKYIWICTNNFLHVNVCMWYLRLPTMVTILDEEKHKLDLIFYLFSGSFWRHNEIIFLNDFPYFFSISLSWTPVSKEGGSFCSVSIKTWKNFQYNINFSWLSKVEYCGQNSSIQTTSQYISSSL